MFLNINHLFTNDKAEKTTPNFTCSVGNHKYYFHTHAPAAQIIYHLEKNALTDDHPTKKLLIDLAASHRNAIQLTKVLFQEYMSCVIFQQLYIASCLRSMLSESRKRGEQEGAKKIEIFPFFGTHVMRPPTMWI